jgi:hypothetical protein
MVQLPKDFDEEAHRKGLVPIIGWPEWVEQNVWNSGVGTWNVANPQYAFTKGVPPDKPRWGCRVCDDRTDRTTSLQEMVDHINTPEHQEALMLVKLSGINPAELT